MAGTRNHTNIVESGTQYWYIELERNLDQKWAGRYLPKGNHSGCDVAHTLKHCCLLRLTVRNFDFRQPRAESWRLGFQEGAKNPCVQYNEVRRIFTDLMSYLSKYCPNFVTTIFHGYIF